MIGLRCVEALSDNSSGRVDNLCAPQLGIVGLHAPWLGSVDLYAP